MASNKEIAKEFGRYAEEMAVQEYIKRGYTVLQRNARYGKSEIDFIAQKDNTIIFIEVKARSSDEADAIEAVTVDKRRRMIRVADLYLKRLNGIFNYRFDIVASFGSKEDFHMDIIEDAFLASDLF